MFKKRPNIKTLAPLRSSDRRKVIDQIIADYQIEVPKSLPAEGQTEEQAHATCLTALRNSLLPEGAQSARFSTTVGADGHQVSGTVYAAQFPDEDVKIYWLKLEDDIIPTVYTLWRHPKLIPLLHTPDIVLEKMRGGADLMTPGLARGPPFPPKARKGSVVAIAAVERPSVPIVVGACEIDVSALTEVRGVKGRAVRGIHWEGDEIWSWSQGGRSAGISPPEHLDGWDGDIVESVARDVAAVSLDDSSGEAANGDENVEVDSKQPEAKSENMAFEDVEKPKKSWQTKDIDIAFKNAYLYAVHEAREKNRNSPTHGLSFPIPQSQFISNMIIPYLPTFDSDDVAALQVKKTSWKNVRKFIKALDKEQLLKSKDRSGGETVVLDIDFDDQQVNDFQPYRLPKKTASGTAQQDEATASTVGADDTIGQKIQIIHLLRPNKSLYPVFAASSADPHALYLPTELRHHLTTYIENEGLIITTDKSRVKINPILADALYATATTTTNDYDAQRVMVQGYVGRDALLARAQTHACTAYHLIKRTLAGAPQENPAAAMAGLDRKTAAAGPPPRVKITLETRSGNKTATRVSGLEPFGVAAGPLADALQKACASSTSVSPLVGSSPKKPVMEVMVQGPQRDATIAQLEKRGVSKSWVDVTDKTKKKGGR